MVIFLSLVALYFLLFSLLLRVFERFLQWGSATGSQKTRQEVSLRMSVTFTNVPKSTRRRMDHRLLLHTHSIYAPARQLVIYVSKLHWARVRFGPVPLASCGNGSGVNSPTAVSFTVFFLSNSPVDQVTSKNSIIA